MVVSIVVAVVSTFAGSLFAALLSGAKEHRRARKEEAERKKREDENTAHVLTALENLVEEVKKQSAADHVQINNMRAVVLYLAKLQLHAQHNKYVLQDKWCSPEDKEDVKELYEAYHSLGGNGLGTRWKSAILALPEIPADIEPAIEW